ncbi:1-phosphatidylinositol 4,5-bisphosphate phosphodiesterase gamma-1-like isoform X2 [Biomphalaria glabrata]|uniref:1-phosphatidylinositol 4,5-bisphosphate phosphodiesterase gamma n=1 Tax=Biomphalaria glabrata TaxID=6526 RepID=A0A9W3AVK2_BIOGL|nr:1-phosphatidylinositol 4,5-bisphosphate phosphodiesterase gamma-1-like isoform X2 [Biomphalaria glabrata]
MASIMVNGGPPTPDLVEIMRLLEMGLVTTIFFYRKRPERKTLKVKLESRQLMWIKTQAGRPEGVASLRDVKEFRCGKNSRDFEKWPEEAKKVDSRITFTIYYGNDFKLKSLSVVANDANEFGMWRKGLDYLVKESKEASYQLQVERWLRKEFYLMEKYGSYILTLKNLKAWLPRINFKMPTNRLRERFQEFDTESKGEINFEQFSALYNKLIHVTSIIDDNFSKYFEVYGEDKRMRAESFQLFLLEEQKETKANDLSYVKELMLGFLEDPVRAARGTYFTQQEFEKYLFSNHNPLYDSKFESVTQDMNQPLTSYWIASSHNTYLTGDQLYSSSSPEAYARALRMGCRCIELDCWDGPDGYPNIYHGHTLTSKIKFLDVLKTIHDHAWDTSEYPLIISIENHCNLSQQRNMAIAFRETFGDKLLMEPLQKDAVLMPSPNELRFKIILKHKKLPEWVDDNEWRYAVSSEDSGTLEPDLSSSVKNGILYLEDQNEGTWHPHFFVLSGSKLFYAEETPTEQDDDEDDEGSVEGRPVDELHYSEKWFHGRLEGGRKRAEELLRQYSYLGDGTFLVRESDTFVGDFSLSFWRQGRVNHCRIKSRQDRGQVKYYLIDAVTFDSLYHLIVHYRQFPLRSSDFTQVLKEPVPQPQSHEGKPWYHKEMSRGEAEELLKRIPKDGAFLVRHSVQDQQSYAISFRAEGKIKHCRIKLEGRLFLIGNAQFESLCELVQYYEHTPLYKKMKLRQPVNHQLVEMTNMTPDDTGIYGAPDLYINPNDFTTKPPDESDIYDSGIYHQPNDFVSKSPSIKSSSSLKLKFRLTRLRVKALHDYSANRSDELSFCKDAIITNVSKQDGGWWRGDYGSKKQLWFPANYVEEIDTQAENPAESNPLGVLQQGAIDVQGCIIDVLQPRGNRFLFRIAPIKNSPTIEIAVDSEEDMKDWIEKISISSSTALQRTTGQKQLERTMRIAREFSDLIVYCRAVPFNPDEIPGPYYEMSSFPETKVEKWVNKHRAKQFIAYHRKQLSRVYPKGQRVDSSNYDPVPIWNCGSQMLALNYQTPDKSMQLNQGRFLMNGRSGYVLQPSVMRSDLYSPYEKKFLSALNVEPLTLTINIMGARHLVKQGRGVASPYVEIEIVGMECDNQKYKTAPHVDNGLNPIWSDSCVFDILCPELALIRFAVMDEDIFGDPNFLGQATYPVPCIKSGYRAVQLCNGYSEKLELASLLVYVEMRNPKEGEESDIYASIQELKEESDKLAAELETLEIRGDREHANVVKKELQETQERLLAKHQERQLRKCGSRHQVKYIRQSNA